MVCLSIAYHFRFFKGCLTQILLGPFLNTCPKCKQKIKSPTYYCSKNPEVCLGNCHIWPQKTSLGFFLLSMLTCMHRSKMILPLIGEIVNPWIMQSDWMTQIPNHVVRKKCLSFLIFNDSSFNSGNIAS